MNIELKPIAESKVRQLGGDVCGVLVRKDGRLAAVDEHGRVRWLQDDGGEYAAYLEGMNSHLKAELEAARAQSGQGAEPVADQWLIQMRGDYLVTRGVWECPDHRGYTNDINEAGRYSEDEAKEAERMMPEKCKAVRLPAQQGSVSQGPLKSCACQFNAKGELLKECLFHQTRYKPQLEGDGNKRHWYALSYRGRDRESGCTADAVTYTGYPENALTMARIQAAKADAGVDDKAVLVCATYLGHMTKEEFTAQPPREGE